MSNVIDTNTRPSPNPVTVTPSPADRAFDYPAERREEWEKFRGQSPMQKALYEIGLTPQLAAEMLQKELNATTIKAQVVEKTVITTDAETGERVEERTKEWSYSKPMVDWATRQRARQDLTRYWGGMVKSDEGDGSEEGTSVVVQIRRFSEEVA